MASQVRLDSRWTRSLLPDERPKFEQAVYNDTLVLGRLLAILENEYSSNEREDDGVNQFTNPNWQYVTAFRSGERSALKKVMTLLNFLKD